MLNVTPVFEDMTAANTKFILLLRLTSAIKMMDSIIQKNIRKYLQRKIGEVWHNYIEKVTQVLLQKIFSNHRVDCITDVLAAPVAFVSARESS